MRIYSSLSLNVNPLVKDEFSVRSMLAATYSDGDLCVYLYICVDLFPPEVPLLWMKTTE